MNRPDRSPAGALFATGRTLPAVNLPLEKLQEQIRRELQTMPHLSGLRQSNHDNLRIVLEYFQGARETATLLDIGASIHGFALEQAAALGVAEYIGIDLGVKHKWETQLLRVTDGSRSHLLCQMDAHRLWFEDESMDVILCLSGFEHYLYPELVLGELMRVLKKGGTALISYEPIWTCSYGHHLHHFGIGFEQVPPWSHLLLLKSQLAELLQEKEWPRVCPISKTEAVDWVYNGREINRRDVRFHEHLLRQIQCTELLWLLPNLDSAPQAQSSVDYVASLLPYRREELLTRGFSCCFRK
jgi:SAM-dependent methyltransferase